jgi:drug/metabolite transporter (DMT)-like permease
VWGTADYSGGRVSRHVNATSVTVASQLVSLPVVAVCVIALPGQLYGVDLLWGAGAGTAGAIGVILLYASLSTGAMAVAAPTSAVTGAAVPIAVGLLLGEQPSLAALIGVGCAVVAIALVSASGGSGPVTARVLGMALGAGALFGIFFVLLAQTHDDSGMWPLVGARTTSVLLGLFLVLGRRLPLRMPRRLLGWVLVSGVGDIGANALYLLATREGLLSVVAPISALYPVATVLLAFALDRERVRPVQVVGLGLAAVSLVLTAV